jgi:aminocarboxymuconate-semialdehyde decarboxylase
MAEVCSACDRRRPNESTRSGLGHQVNVDLHCHTFPDAYVSLLRSEGSVQDVTFVPGERGAEQLLVDGGKQTLTLTARMCSPESLLAAMDEARLDVAALSPASNMYHYGADASMARRLARAINEGFASLSAESPARLKFFATVPMQHPGWALSELDYAVRELGAVGIAIATNVQGANLDTPDFWTVFERVHEYDIPLFIHPAHVAGADRLSRYFLSNLIGNPVDTSIAVASLIFGGVMDRLPGLKVIVCHGGGVVPCLRGRWRHGVHVRPAIAEATSSNVDHLIDRLYFDTITHDTDLLRFLLETMSDDRLVLGSDYPFEMGDPRPVDSLEAMGQLSESSREKILGGNAARLLGLGAGGHS